MKRIYVPAFTLLALPLLVTADVVVPADSVEKYVMIRIEPKGGTESIGRLQPGQHLRYVRSVPRWHEVVLDDGRTGYVSQTWTKVLPDPSEPTDAVGEPETLDAPGHAEMVVESAEPEPADAESVVEIKDTEEEPAPDYERESQGEETEIESSAEEAPESPIVHTVVEVPEEVAEPEPPEAPAPADDRGVADIKGAADFVAKFVGPRKIRTSQIFDDGSNVGIGTEYPEHRLEVNGNVHIRERNGRVVALLLTPSSSETAFITYDIANAITIGSGSAKRIVIDASGNVGIGQPRPDHPLQMANGAHVTAGGVWTNSSSVDAKENITTLTLDEALAALEELKPVRFNYRVDEKDHYVGFIAEDVPELVASKDRRGLSSMDIVAVLARVVQAQQAKIEELEARLDMQ